MRHAGFAFALLLVATPALADDTALNEGRYGPEPIGGGLTGPESAIRMVREDLQFTIGRKQSSVVARFVFQNSLDVPAKQLVGFPDLAAAQQEVKRRDPTGAKVWTYEYALQGPIQGMQTRVDGKPVTSALRFGYVTGEYEHWRATQDPRGSLMAWHAMWVDFPPHQPVVIERRYHTDNGTNVLGQSFFNYVVSTGGIWKGTIGELVADATLTNGLKSKDLAWGLKPEQGRGCTPGKASWQELSPTHLRLTWKDFEPRGTHKYDNIELVTWPTIGVDGKPFKKR